MLPAEKALVERLANEPFALIGINSDDDGFEEVAARLKKEGITWRQAMEGSTSGPIPARWNVQSWPTIYLVDAKGVIRHKGLHDMGAIEDAIESLLAEAKAGVR
jgi:hypothetical protein